MKTLRDIALLYRRSFVQTFRVPVWLAISFSTPLLYLALFTPLLKSLPGGSEFPPGINVLEIFLPGILALMAFMSGASAGFSTIFELQAGYTERIRVTPASRLALLIGPILSSLTWTFFFMTMIVVVAEPFGFPIHIAGLLIAYVLLALLMVLFASFSIAVALLTKEINSFAAVVNGINLPLLLLAGILLPLELGPAWMRVIGHFNPLYYVVEGDRLLAAGHLWNTTIAEGFLVMVPLTALAVVWATRVYRRAVS
ncbi:MAG: ABC transporter permease [Actinobacteria bacterium]|nr:ABC transporter permease [Actinomycetota bacterium]